MDFHLSTKQSSFEQPHRTTIKQNVQPWCPQICIQRSHRHINGRSCQTQSYPQVETVDSITQSTRCEQGPIMALPIEPQPTPTVVSKLTSPTSNDITITPIIPTDPLFPPHLWPKRPYHLGEDIMEFGRGMHFFRVEEWDDDYYWITCCMDYTGVKFAIWVGQDLVIDPNPQDMLSWLDRIFLNSFDGPKGCNIGDWEGDARCEGEASVGKGYVEWVVRDEGYGASRLVVQHHQSSHQVSPFWWFYGHLWHHSS